MCKKKCIVLNKAFIGGWTESEESIPHEIINFYKADNTNEIFIYNTPYGCKAGSEKEDYEVKWMFITTGKTSGGYLLQYCIEIEQNMHNKVRAKKQTTKKEKDAVKKKINDGKKEISENLNGRKIESITYGGKPIAFTEENENDKTKRALFEDSPMVFPFTFKAKRIYKAKIPIPFSGMVESSEAPCKNCLVIRRALAGNKKNDAAAEAQKADCKVCTHKPYIYQRNYSCVPEESNKQAYKDAYKELMKSIPLDEKGKLKEEMWEDWTDNIPEFTIPKDDNKRKEFESACKAVKQNKFIDLIDNFKAEECYTKILSKLFSYNNCDFLKVFLKEIYKDNLNLSNEDFHSGNTREEKVDDDGNPVNIGQLDEFKADKYGRIDIYAESKKYCVVIENKIDSNFVDDKSRESFQLARYETWTNKFKKSKEALCIVLFPEYRRDEIQSEYQLALEKYKSKNGLSLSNKWQLKSYKTVYDAFNKYMEMDNCPFKNPAFKFNNTSLLNDVMSLFKRLSLSRQELYTAKLANRIEYLDKTKN